MKVHCCALDKQCRDVGAPARLLVSTRRWHYTLALTPNGKVQKSPFDYHTTTWWRRDQRR